MSAIANRVLQGLGWTGVAVVFAALVVRFTLPDRQELWWWLAVSGLAMVAVHTLSQWRDILAFFSRRQAREGVMATSGVALALGILVAVNYILSRQNVRWDLTAAQQYSLSDQTRRVLEELDAPISVLVFAREAEFPGFRDRLDEYAYVSSQVNVEYIDVDRSPVRARQYEVQAYGTIVFDYEGRIERTTSNSEQELTNALIKAVEGEERTVYFVQGHGERDPEGDDRDGYRAVRDALGRDNFRVESVVLAQTGEVPADATVMVVAGPSTDLLPAEADLLRAYLEGGGKLLLMLDPPDTEDDPPQPNLTALAGEWGIELGTDVVVDASGVGQLLGTDASVPVAATYPPHAITDGFNLLTAFPLARSVRPAIGGVAGRTGVVVVETGARSWAEADLSQLATGEVTLDEDAGDVPGPVPIATVVSQTIEEPEPAPDDEDADGAADSSAGDTDADDDEPPLEARLAVFGDSDFASNSAVGIQGNRDLALNTINWLAQQENLIAIRPREPEDRRITLTADQQARVYWLSLLLLPGFIAGAGIYTWWGRRG
ncbi:MAG: Gldg family protein [Acidobacteriota bacterium]|nr:Gldg family protein [Acidobacteriota bacterium]